MVISFSKLFTATNSVNRETCTFLVETVKPPGKETVVVLETIEGVYETREKFEDALDYTVKGWEKGFAHKGEMKRWKLIYLDIPGAKKLVDSLNEAIQTYEEG